MNRLEAIADALNNPNTARWSVRGTAWNDITYLYEIVVNTLEACEVFEADDVRHTMERLIEG